MIGWLRASWAWLNRHNRPQIVEVAASADPVPEPPQVAAEAVMNARALVIGAGQDPVAYAKFRLHQIEGHIGMHPVTAAKMAEFRTETLSLLHALRLGRAVTPEDEAKWLALTAPRVPVVVIGDDEAHD